jgi:hypothetical protein
MKQIAKWLALVSILVFAIVWGVMGLKILNNNYLISIELYIGLVSFIAFFICVLYVKIANRCRHCGKPHHSFGKYCSYCGKEIN